MVAQTLNLLGECAVASGEKGQVTEMLKSAYTLSMSQGDLPTQLGSLGPFSSAVYFFPSDYVLYNPKYDIKPPKPCFNRITTGLQEGGDPAERSRDEAYRKRKAGELDGRVAKAVAGAKHAAVVSGDR
mgnify:CR=1 FL=1